MNTDFATMDLVKDDVLVMWEWIGEGFSGDYNDDDPHDEPLLRFTVCHKVNGDWEQVDDASYCTEVNTDTPEKDLKEMLQYIMDSVYDDVRDGTSIKRCCERLSWIYPGKLPL